MRRPGAHQLWEAELAACRTLCLAANEQARARGAIDVPRTREARRPVVGRSRFGRRPDVGLVGLARGPHDQVRFAARRFRRAGQLDGVLDGADKPPRLAPARWRVARGRARRLSDRVAARRSRDLDRPVPGPVAGGNQSGGESPPSRSRRRVGCTLRRRVGHDRRLGATRERTDRELGACTDLSDCLGEPAPTGMPREGGPGVKSHMSAR